MASHAKYAIGSNGNGKSHSGGATSEKRIAKLLAYHDGIAAALRTTLALLRGEAVEHRETRAPDVLAAAVSIDAARREHKTRAPHNGDYSQFVKQRRERTAAMLATFDLHKPTASLLGRGRIGGLIQNGYLKKVRGGYVRTAKHFEP